MRQGIELLFFAYRDFTAEPDAILARYGFGRAHHRVIHFVGRHPQMTVSELLPILRITKQSLSRVLGQLVRQGFIVQRPGPHDRRQRLLELAPKGRELERQLSEPQRVRIATAYREAGAQRGRGFPRGSARDHRRRGGPPPLRPRAADAALILAYRVIPGDERTEPHLLVVDDDTRLRELLRRYLSDNGFRVTTAEDATEARAKLASFAFDLVVLDVHAARARAGWP